MARLFVKNNSSPALPVPALAKSPSLQNRNSVQMLAGSKSPSLARAVLKDSPPTSPIINRRYSGADIAGALILQTSPAKSAPPKGPPKQVPVFGSSLSSLLAYDSFTTTDQVVPFLVEECISYLNRDEMLKVEGIFRQSGKSTEVQDVKRSYDAGNYITLFKISDVHVVTGLLKLYLRSLPEPLVPFSSYDSFVNFQKTKAGKDGSIEELRKLIAELPFENKVLLKCLCLLLKKAAGFEKNSKMNANSLSIVIGPNIMRSENIDMLKAMEESPLINYLTASLIENADAIFNGTDLTPDLNFFAAKRKRNPPVYLPYQEFQEKLQERKKTRSFLAAWFQKRSKPEDLVKKKIFTEFDMTGFRNSREYSYGQY